MLDRRRPTALVVDDTPANRYALARILERGGFDVVEAATGEEGLRRAEEHQVDLVVLDVKLPDMLGFEVAERLRASETTAHIAILHVSASLVDSDSQVVGLGRGADGYLVHPVEPALLVATASALVRVRESERKQLRLARELESAIRSRDELLSMVSHDLRNPLNALRLRLEVLVRTTERGDQLTPERLVPSYRAAMGHVDAMTRLLDQLLDLSRIRAGRIDLQLAELDLAAIAAEVVERMREQARTAGCTFELHAEAPVIGEWDRSRLEQIVSNLVSNAIKYAPGRPVEITVESIGALARIVVADHGPGIPKSEQTRIFDRFERGNGRSGAARESFGLGLWIVHRLVDALGGTIRVESEPGHGARFTVHLPRSPGTSL